VVLKDRAGEEVGSSLPPGPRAANWHTGTHILDTCVQIYVYICTGSPSTSGSQELAFQG
jgi:hypothetical protein